MSNESDCNTANSSDPSGSSSSRTAGGGGGGGGPCGACKFLRRKCVKGCVFAPYFDADQGPAHFAAVHRVFGASNASKLLARVPANRRLDAVVTLCYEALARARDPVYGCVGHIFALQQQVMNLQAELAYVQARLATLQHFPLQPQPPRSPPPCDLQSSSTTALLSEMVPNPSLPNMYFNSFQLHSSVSAGLQNFRMNPAEERELDDAQLHSLARVFISSSRHLPPPGVRFDGSSPRKNL
ncbi:LOB domain-containing protein 19-like [Syzygium oleosum]|uniref:LOB domain-containing protein 19-like n=1 Tax=Syzygium oleosum TaxID=219896 RepID=UPI0024BA979C|nr:LOB domain-containing protein 19-like [Syzygium oleosum]